MKCAGGGTISRSSTKTATLIANVERPHVVWGRISKMTEVGLSHCSQIAYHARPYPPELDKRNAEDKFSPNSNIYS
ncbi:hypothetical protein GCM10011389_18320 [Pontibacillus salipaludis]|uniref:Uncharacterized protein n=1 Tax=Pontibacillus salipaludis TaxID=1697394 RepID=A0ABQ1Q2H4_9BACI|nr:hypothetical protein GCM10011389_18320 [Pontibacillus salipaludis]